jgi:hypothetical protein
MFPSLLEMGISFSLLHRLGRVAYRALHHKTNTPIFSIKQPNKERLFHYHGIDSSIEPMRPLSGKKIINI